MRIELDLPDWVDERHIRILAGVELVAFKLQTSDNWRIKENRCNQCGKCCDMPAHNQKYRRMKKGWCEHLKQDGKKRVCSIAYDRVQCFNDPISMIKSGECSITYKVK